MRRCFHVVALASMVLWLMGCPASSPTDPGPAVGESDVPPPPPPPPAAQSPAPVASTASPPASASSTGLPSPSPASPATTDDTSKPSQAVSAVAQSVRLSMGVALPQTGPEGILMSFSVEYDAPPSTSRSAEYVWVIERKHGTPFKQPVRMSGHDTLIVLINGWRPTEAPFQTHIEDRQGNRLSPSIELEGPGLPPG